jgi:hypothetical protein
MRDGPVLKSRNSGWTTIGAHPITVFIAQGWSPELL